MSSFEPWDWPYAFNSRFYLWNNDHYVINKNYFFKAILYYITGTIAVLSLTTTFCWLWDRHLDYPLMSEEDKGTRGWDRWKVLFQKLLLPFFIFGFFILFIMSQFKPGSDNWYLLLSLFFIMSFIGIAFQVGTAVSWAIGLTLSGIVFFQLVPSS